MAIDAEETMHILERFTKLKQRDIPKELEDYLIYVAKTGDTVYTWANVKHLYREKLIHVIKDFHESTANIDDLPQYPNVDLFNYETMKRSLVENLNLFHSAPFTIQRLSELLTEPRKQYSRIDKFMRALEKNILVVSTVEPGRKIESENGDFLDSVVNGDLSLVVNVDLNIENESLFAVEQNINVPGTTSNNGTLPMNISGETSGDQPNKSEKTNNNETEQNVNVYKGSKEDLQCEEVSCFLNEDDSEEFTYEDKIIESQKLVEKNQKLDNIKINESTINSVEDKLLNINQLVTNEILTEIQEDNLLNVEDILNSDVVTHSDNTENIKNSVEEVNESKSEEATELKNIFENVISIERETENKKLLEIKVDNTISTKSNFGIIGDLSIEEPDNVEVVPFEPFGTQIVNGNKFLEHMSIEEVSTVAMAENIITETIQPQDLNIADDFDKAPFVDNAMEDNIYGALTTEQTASKIESSMDVDDTATYEAMDQ